MLRSAETLSRELAPTVGYIMTYYQQVPHKYSVLNMLVQGYLAADGNRVLSFRDVLP